MNPKDLIMMLLTQLLLTHWLFRESRIGKMNYGVFNLFRKGLNLTHGLRFN
jgi:hypothetical protein